LHFTTALAILPRRATLADMETYKKWEPLEGIEAELWVEALHDDYEGLRIILRGNPVKSPVLRITFRHYYMYRNADESYRLAIVEGSAI
jgi:hypothetical protein